MKRLFLIMIIIATTILGSCENKNDTTDGQASMLPISVDDAKTMIEQNVDNDNFVILDIRTPSEYNAGYIENAINIDYYASDFVAQLDTQDKNKTYLVYCRSANRSTRALSTFSSLDFAKVYNMQGGINAWVSSGYALIR